MATQAPQEADPDRRVLTEAVINAAGLLGLSNGDLAEVIGVSASTVSRMQRGPTTSSPSPRCGS